MPLLGYGSDGEICLGKVKLYGLEIRFHVCLSINGWQGKLAVAENVVL